jgi:hypothetical protein
MMIPLSGRVPGRASELSRTRVDDDSGYGTFCGWRLGPLGSSRGCEFICGRARSVGTRGSHTMGQCGQGWAAPPPGVDGSLLVSISPLDSVFVSIK